MEPSEPTPGRIPSELITANPRSPQKRSAPLDAAVGVAALGFGAASFLVREANRVVKPIAEIALHPPLVPQRLHPARLVDLLSGYGQATTTVVGGDLGRVLTVVVPYVVKELLDRLDLNAIVRQRVDLDGIVAEVDIGAVIDRVDLDAIVAKVDIERVLDRLDLDAIVAKVDIEAVIDRLDLDAIVAKVDIESVLDRLDLDAIVAKVNIEAVIDRLDLDAIVAKVDIESVLDRLDLDAIVARVDLDRVIARVDIDGIVAEVNLDAIIDRLNVVGLAEDVINEIDLPEIIRDSTGSMASEVVRGARLQSIDADEAVSRFFDRLIRRRQRRTALTPTQAARLREDDADVVDAIPPAGALPPGPVPDQPGSPARPATESDRAAR